MSPISSFEMNKVKIFQVLTAPRSLIFLSNLFKRDEVALVANLGITSLTKGTARSSNTFLSKLPNVLPRNLPDWIALDNKDLLSFIFTSILLAKAFLFVVFCLVVKNNSWWKSSSWKFFLVILNVVPLLFFAADFNLFSCVFVSLTLAFIKTLILSWENFNRVSLILSKIDKTGMYWTQPKSVELPLTSSFLMVQGNLFPEFLLY